MKVNCEYITAVQSPRSYNFFQDHQNNVLNTSQSQASLTSTPKGDKQTFHLDFNNIEGKKETLGFNLMNIDDQTDRHRSNVQQKQNAIRPKKLSFTTSSRQSNTHTPAQYKAQFNLSFQERHEIILQKDNLKSQFNKNTNGINQQQNICSFKQNDQLNSSTHNLSPTSKRKLDKQANKNINLNLKERSFSEQFQVENSNRPRNNSKDQKEEKQSSKSKIRKSNWRWVQLFLISLYSLASFYGLQVPSPLQQQYMKDYEITPTQFNNLFVMFSIPNIILPLLAGPLSQKIGLMNAMCFYTIIMMIGQYLQYLSSFDNAYLLLSIGTLVFGVGVNGSVVLINSFTCHWFIGSELSTALSVINAIQYLGQVLASLILSPLYSIKGNLQLPLFASFLIICICLVSYIFMLIIEKYAQKMEQQENNVSNIEQEEQIISLKDMKNFGNLFWQINICVFVAYACLCYNNNIDSLLTTNYNLDGITAGRYIAMQFLIQLPLTPLIGYFTDNYGKRAQIMILGSIVNVIQFLVFLLVPICPSQSYETGCQSWYYILPLCLGGIGNSLFGAVFAPMVAMTVDEEFLEMGFGVLDGMQQLGNSIAPILMGHLLEKTKKDNGFFYFFVFTLLLAIVQLIQSGYIYKLDIDNIFETTYKFIQNIKHEFSIHRLNNILLNKSSRSQIFLEPRNLIQPISAKMGKIQKLEILKKQKWISLAGSAFSILCLYCLISLEDKFEIHIQNIINYLIVSIILVFLFFIGSFLWANYIQKAIEKSYDDAAAEVASDNNHLSKIILFLGLTLITIFLVYTIAYQLEYILFKEYQNNELTIDIQRLALGLKPYTNKKGMLILVFSIFMFLGLAMSIYSSYIMSCKSNTTDKFMIQLLSMVLLIVCFAQIIKHFTIKELEKQKSFKKVINNQHHQLLQYSAYITIGYLCIVNLFCYFEESNSANFISKIAKKSQKKIKYILGYSQICLILFIIYPIIQNFIDYQQIYKYFIQNCTEELGELDAQFVESYDVQDDCFHKYYYNHQIKCPSKIPSDCFQDYNTCAKMNLQSVWERYLVEDPERNITLACIEKKCCKVLTILYALPKLNYGVFSLLNVFFSLEMVFFLIYFKVHKGQHQIAQNENEIPDEQVGEAKFFVRKAEQTYLPLIQKTIIFLFVIVLVEGSVLIYQNRNMQLFVPSRSNVLGSVQINPDDDLKNYDYKKSQQTLIQHQNSHILLNEQFSNNPTVNINHMNKSLKGHSQIKGQQHEKKYNDIQKFQVIILDLETDNPIPQASISVYHVKEVTNKSHDCDENLYEYPLFLYETGADGTAIFPIAFTSQLDKLNLVIFAKKQGYTGNCRMLTLTEDNIKNYQLYDISLGYMLGKGQARVLLEWDIQYINDLDLYVQFGNYTSSGYGRFICQIGVHHSECGGVVHHGDSITKLIGKSSEAITFTVIGHYEYLVYVNRFVQDLQQRLDEDPQFNYATQIQKSKPIIKYYTEGYKWPLKTIINDQNLDIYNNVIKFSLLQFCILGNNNDMRIRIFPQKNSIWSNIQYPLYDLTDTSDLPNTASILYSTNQMICEQPLKL